MAEKLNSVIAVIGIDIGKNSFYIIGLDGRGAIALRQKWSRGQLDMRLANMPACLIGMEACVGARAWSTSWRIWLATGVGWMSGSKACRAKSMCSHARMPVATG
jgi:hypothetical protein